MVGKKRESGQWRYGTYNSSQFSLKRISKAKNNVGGKSGCASKIERKNDQYKRLIERDGKEGKRKKPGHEPMRNFLDGQRICREKESEKYRRECRESVKVCSFKKRGRKS